MASLPNLAPIGALVGDQARATMLTELMHGRALTATELAARAGVSSATASVHLAKLVAAGLLAVEPQGRHRYFRLAGRHVARALETLAGLAPPAREELAPADDIRLARTCYDHLAGWLGVAVKEALVKERLLAIEGSEIRVTARGETWLGEIGVDVAAAREARRSFARACLDWSERRHHVAGSLGQALLEGFVRRRWLARREGERALDLTASGRRELDRRLGIRIPGTGERSLP
jgi:DNA-binding transcriptional ArsR family regulator